jgi:flagellar biosynthesis protein FlhF
MEVKVSHRSTPESGVHTFTAKSVRHALNDVRKTLGADALILSQQNVGDRVVVRAALEAPMPPQSAPAQTSILPPVEPIPEAATPADLPEASPEDRPESGAELAVLPQVDRSAASPRPEDLEYFGEPVSRLRGCYRMLGSSGVGKTTSIIRLMVEWVAHRGGQSVTVISTDTRKLAGRESLALACQMLDVELCEITHRELAPLVQKLSLSQELILVDTGALDASDEHVFVPQVKDILVCSSQHSRQALAGVYNRLVHTDLAGVALTHMDLSADGEGLLKTVHSWQRPIYWLGTSANLIDGMEFARPERMEELLFHTEIAFDVDSPVKNLTPAEPGRVHALA